MPSALVACVGGGSNAIGLFHPFLGKRSVRMIGVEAGGRGVKSGAHAARFQGGSLGVLQGTRTFVLQDDDGQIQLTHSVSAGLDTILKRLLEKRGELKLNCILGLLLTVLLASTTIALAADRPITDIICDMGNSTIEQVRDEAAHQAQYDQPKVRSTIVQTIRFSGTFTPTDSDKAIVIFSDDGCRVTINGIVVFDNFRKGQHLPNLERSFHLLPTFLRKGETVTIVVEYSNILYTGEGDMDGVTLFLLDQDSDFRMCSDGEALFSQNSFNDVNSLVAKLSAQKDPVSEYLWTRFSPETRAALTAKGAPVAQLKSILAKELNAILSDKSLYAADRFAAVSLSSKTRHLLAREGKDQDVVRLNRLLLENTYSMEIASSTGCTAHGLRETIAVGDLHHVTLREWKVHTGPQIPHLRRFSVSFPNAAAQVNGMHLQQITATPTERWSITSSTHVGTLTALSRFRTFQAEAALTIAGINPGTVTLTLFDDRDPSKKNIVRNTNGAGQPDSRETVVVAAGPFSPSWAALIPGMSITLAIATNPGSVNWPTIASSSSGELWPTFSITSSVPSLLEVLTITRHLGVALVTVRANATLTGVATITANVGTSTSEATVNVVSGGVATLTFSGADFRNVRMDNSGNYPTPHWDANRLATGGTNSPVCYVRSGTFTVTAGFTLTAAGTTTGIVRGTLSSGGTVSGAVTLGATSFSVTGLQNSQTVSNSVNYFNPLTITWALSLDGGATFLPMGTTSNVVYVTLETPTASPLFETLLHIGCRNANLKDTAADVVADIWNDFSDRSVLRVDGIQMIYWLGGAVPDAQQRLAGMLASADGNGSCISWSQLFHQTLKAQGIAGSQIFKIVPDTTVNPNATGFMVKNWKFDRHIRTGPNAINDTDTAGDDLALFPKGNPAPNGLPDQPCIYPGPDGVLNSSPGGDDTSQDGLFPGTHYPYEFGLDAVDQDGIPGQGNPRPPRAFVDHWIVKFGGQIYDPSYGGTPYPSEQAHEDAAIDGICSATVTPGKLRARKKSAAKELIYIHDPSKE